MRVGVIGASGAVGRELVDVLGRRAFPMTSLRLFASARSAGTKLKTPLGEAEIEPFSDALMLCASSNRKTRHESTNDEGEFRLICQQ